MKKTVLAVILVIFSFISAYGQSAPIDLILVLDTSSQMGSSYEYVNNYLTDPFLKEFMRVGDTFHLIPFSGTPRLDVARRISGIGDVETIIGRMLLQYPVESGVNVSGALSFTEQYITTLPVREKKIVLITLAGTDVTELVNAARQRVSSSNTTIDYIQVTPGRPLSNVPLSGRAPMPAGTSPPAPPVTTGSDSGIASGTTETSSGEAAATDSPVTTAPAASPPELSTSSSTAAPEVSTTASEEASAAAAETSGTASAAASSASTVPSTAAADTDTAATTTSDIAATAADTAARPQVASSPTNASESRTSIAFSPLLIIIILLALLVLALIIFFATRKLNSRPNRVMAETASATPSDKRADKQPESRVESRRELSAYTANQARRSTPYDNRVTEKNKPVEISPTGPLLLNLFVEDQNTSIGKRNIHSLKSGYSFTVGGSRSDDFLLFLVPMPAHLGIIRRNGRDLTFIPRKAKYFPDIGSNEVRNCVNKTIRAVSDKNYEVRFRFEMYEDPLVSLNKIMNSVRVPG